MKPNPAILLGICGGIAAYKAIEVASRFRKQGCSVHVAMTDAARAFVAPLTFSAITANPVLDRILPDGAAAGESAYPHLFPASRADVFVVLPATANTIAKLALGIGDNCVTTSALSLPPSCLRVFCPAMNVEMWRNPVVQANVRRLEESGWIRIGPESGALACGMEGEGRLADPSKIVEVVWQRLRAPRPLSGKRVLILSGPTREHLDPVRFLSNASSGKMGRALALAAADAGAEVEFITGPVPPENLPQGPSIHLTHIISAAELIEAAKSRFAVANLILHAAAVADFRPAGGANPIKLPKSESTMNLPLEPVPDVAATLNAEKQPGQISIGFALQTHDGLNQAANKLVQKRFDAILLNSPEALGSDSATYTWIQSGQPPEDWGPLSKIDCARRIIDRAVSLLG